MSAKERVESYARMNGCSAVDAAYVLFGMGSIDIDELEAIEAAEGEGAKS